MKYIIAVIQPDRLDEVLDGLTEKDIHLVTVSNVMGRGRQKGISEVYRSHKEAGSLLKKVKIEVNYFKAHRDHLHYQAVDEQGGPIGSGAVESLCSQLQDRFKRTGQFWTRTGLRHLLAVEEALRNHDFDPRCN